MNNLELLFVNLICSEFSRANLLFGNSELWSRNLFLVHFLCLVQVDAALVLLGNMISSVSMSVWLYPLRLFRKIFMQLCSDIFNILYYKLSYIAIYLLRILYIHVSYLRIYGTLGHSNKCHQCKRILHICLPINDYIQFCKYLVIIYKALHVLCNLFFMLHYLEVFLIERTPLQY